LVSVLVPARNEAARIGPCIQALLRQRGINLELLVLNDGSTDGTAEVVRATAEKDLRVTLLDGAPLPPGWLGKPHACAQLAAASRGDVLVFIDADVEVEPDGIAATVALLGPQGDLDLVCPYPCQRAETPGERSSSRSCSGRGSRSYRSAWLSA
jgi:glycosyltransferase involved in cell wall biosynthesis